VHYGLSASHIRLLGRLSKGGRTCSMHGEHRIHSEISLKRPLEGCRRGWEAYIEKKLY